MSYAFVNLSSPSTVTSLPVPRLTETDKEQLVLSMEKCMKEMAAKSFTRYNPSLSR